MSPRLAHGSALDTSTAAKVPGPGSYNMQDFGYSKGKINITMSGRPQSALKSTSTSSTPGPGAYQSQLAIASPRFTMRPKLDNSNSPRRSGKYHRTSFIICC